MLLLGGVQKGKLFRYSLNQAVFMLVAAWYCIVEGGCMLGCRRVGVGAEGD